MIRFLAAVVVAASLALAAAAEDAPAKPGELPAIGSARRLDGELLAVDFVHRTGRFRAKVAGLIHHFVMPPYGIVRQMGTDADLRDVPLGATCRFFLLLDADGEFTRLAVLQDQFSADQAEGIKYRLDEAVRDGKLTTTRHAAMDLGKQTLIVTDETHVWKGGMPVKLTDLAPGDELLVNLTGVTGNNPGRCTDVWAGVDSHKQATETQRRAHTVFLKDRGLAGYVNRTEGKTLTVTLFGGDRAEFAEAWAKEFAKDRDVRVCVANDELRTWNPPVDHEYGKIIEVQRDPVEGIGNSGIRLKVTVNFMLEGFRKGRVVRIFAGPWPLKDQPNGEQLFHYGNRAHPADLMELPPKEYPGQFPFRTDWSNEHLPWYKLRPGVVPPPYAEHVISGELVAVDAVQKTGRFLADRSGTPVEFKLTPEGEVRYLNAKADLAAIPIGTHCRFALFQDEAGAFTRASLVSDEASEQVANGAVWRVTALHLDKGTGTFDAARQPPGVRNDRDEPEQPPDVGRARLRVGAKTRVWKGDKRVTVGDLAVGDLLLFNTMGERPGHPAVCTDIWVGVDTHKLVTERQLQKAPATQK